MHILLATDGSETARLAQEHILALPWPTPVHVTVMTAIEAPHPPFTSLTPEAREAYTPAVGALRQDVEGKAAEVVRAARRERYRRTWPRRFPARQSTGKDAPKSP